MPEPLVFEHDWRERVGVACHRDAGPERLPDFTAKGWAQRHFFPHRVYQLPKGGPDGLKLAWRMCGVDDPACLAELVLYALPPTVDEFPAELFFAPEVQWHRQHYGRVGQVASANLVLGRDRLSAMVYVSDLVQRIARRREHKTRIENRFKGWHRLLLNAVMNVAIDRGVRSVHSATAALAMTHTDANRHVGPALFTRVYDDGVQDLFAAEREGAWWRIDVAANRDRVVLLDKGADVMPTTKTICLCHDIEGGYGSRANPELAARADVSLDATLGRMLEIERRAGIRATYNVLGVLFARVRARIEGEGHACGFHEMAARGVPFEAWRRKALALIDAYPFVAFSLHDCYADRWLDHYEDFLGAIRDRGRFRTLDEVAADVAFRHARWV